MIVHLVVVGGRDTEKVYSDVYAMNLYTGEKLVAQLDYPILRLVRGGEIHIKHRHKEIESLPQTLIF